MNTLTQRTNDIDCNSVSLPQWPNTAKEALRHNFITVDVIQFSDNPLYSLPTDSRLHNNQNMNVITSLQLLHQTRKVTGPCRLTIPRNNVNQS